MGLPTRFALVSLCFILLLSGCTPEPSPEISASPRPQPSRTPINEPVGDNQPIPTSKSKLELRQVDGGVEIVSNGRGYVLRSSTPLNGLDFGSAPVVKTMLTTSPLLDDQVADNVKYYYVQIQGEQISRPKIITTKNRPLPKMLNPSILIDKVHYYLEVRDQGKGVKRYPVVLGGKPKNRKLHSDNLSTPEGIYRIYNLQPNATYHKAFDIDYPTTVDHFRYTFAQQHQGLSDPGIGGEIQIHGCGIPYNWTFGCIGLRDEDMDEMFAHPEIDVGTRVELVGPTITRDDIKSITAHQSPRAIKAVQVRLKSLGYEVGQPDGALGPATRTALGLYQIKTKLPVTCQLDARTVASLKP